MATFGGSTSFGGDSTTQYRYPSFRQTEKSGEDTFDVTKSPLYTQAQDVASQQLSGNVEGFDTQSNIARETQKAVAAQTAQANRAALMDLGLRDTGTYAEEGYIKPAAEQERDRLDLERRLAADRQTAIREQQVAGQAGASNLLGMASEQAQSRESLGTQKELAYANIGSQERMQERDIASQEGMQEKSIASQENIAKWGIAADEAQQLAGFNQQEKMAYLTAQINEAAANNDVTRQQQLMGYQATLDAEQMQQQYGYDYALTNLRGQIDQALQDDNQAHAMTLLNAQQEFSKEEAAKDRLIQETQLNMQKLGLDYELLRAEIDAGNIDPESAAALVKAEMANRGIEITMADKDAIYAELDRDFMLQQYQWAQTHTEDAIYNEDGSFAGLANSAAEGFNNFLNQTYYGADGKPVVGGGDPAEVAGLTLDNISTMDTEKVSAMLRNADSENNANYDTYTALAAESPTLNVRITDDKKNSLSSFNVNEVYNVGGRLVKVTAERRDVGAGFGGGREHDEIEIMDLATGTKKTFTGFSSDDNNVDTIESWAADLAAL